MLIVPGPGDRSRGQSRSGLTLNLVLGVAFFCYGGYLIFGFRGGHYFVSYWVLILPVVLITRTIRSSNGEKARRREAAKQARYAQPQEAQEAHATGADRRSPGE